MSIMGFYPNSSQFTPYLGLGLGLFSADFSESSIWASSPDGYRRREIVLENVQAIIVSLGVMWEFVEHWNLDFSAKYVGNADVDAVFNGYSGGVLDTVQPGHFPMEHWAMQLGISYTF